MKKVLAIAAYLLAICPTKARADASEDIGRGISEAMKVVSMIEKSWLGTAEVEVRPWDGAWPGQATTVLQLEVGGGLDAHVERWKALARSGDNVEVRGPCFSACTLVIAYVPKQRICFGEYSSLYFHFPRTLSGEWLMRSKDWMWDQYPDDVQKWLITRNFDNLTFGDFWELKAEELWAMGYRQCKPLPAIPMTVRKTP